MKINIDSEQLITDVKEDIELFGPDFKVYAVYSLRMVEGQEFEHISDYVDAEPPMRDEVEVPGLFGKLDVPELGESDEAEYQKLLVDYKANIANLKETKHRLMTLAELLELLVEQNRVI